MNRISSTLREQFQFLNPGQKSFLDGIMSSLERINPAILDKADITVTHEKLEIEIWSSHHPYLSVSVLYGRDQFILGISESEILEQHSGSIAHDIIEQAQNLINRYLKGVRILEYLDKNGKLIRREHYFLDGKKIGESVIPRLFNRKDEETTIQEYKFTEDT